MRKSVKILLTAFALTALTALSACTGCVASGGSGSSGSGSSNSGIIEQELTLTMQTELTLIEGDTYVLQFESSVEKDALKINWRSSDRNVVDFKMGADGFATLTAKKAGEATVMLTVKSGDVQKTCTCAVTVNEYKNENLRLIYQIAQDDDKYAVQTNASEGGYKYNEDVTVKITPKLGYALTAIQIGAENVVRYDVNAFTKAEDGSYEITFKANIRPSGDETLLTVPVAVETQEITLTCTADKTLKVSGLPEDGKYSIGQTVNLSVEWQNEADAAQNVYTVYLNGSELTEGESGYSFDITSATNKLVVLAGKAVQTVTFSGKVVTGESFIQTLKTVSTHSVLLATYKYDQALTAEKYQFGLRLYNEGEFISNIDIKREGDMLGLVAKSGEQYTIKNVENVLNRLENGTFGIGVKRAGISYEIYVTDGDELVKALTLTLKASKSFWNKIGCTPDKNSTPAGGTVSYVYVCYDGERNIEGYLNPAVAVTSKKVEISGLKNGGTLPLWSTVNFTVTPNSGCELSSVVLNGEALNAVSEKGGVYSYAAYVKDPLNFNLVATAEDPTAPATINWSNAGGLTVTVTSGEKPQYHATDVIEFTVKSASKLTVFDGITHNGLAVTAAQNGAYKVRLGEGENVITVLSHSAIVTGASEGHADTKTGSEIPDQLSKISEAIASPSPFGTLVTMLKFEEATVQTAAKWRIDLRFYGAEDTSAFLPISIGKDAQGLCISKRFATDATLYYKNLGDGNYSESGVLDMLANGTYRLAIVRTEGKTYTVYADNGLGELVCMGSISGVGGITDSMLLYKIAFGGTSDGICNSQSRTCSISWTWYDSLTDADYVLGYHYRDSLAVKPKTSAKNVTFSGLNGSYSFGDTVSFNVTAANNYSVKKVTVNGEEVELNGNAVSFKLQAYRLEIAVETVAAATAVQSTISGTGQISGLQSSYEYGSTATFTVTTANAADVVYVTLNGEPLAASASGAYSFTVGETAQISVRVISASKATITLNANSEAIDISAINTELDHFDAGDKVSFTATVKKNIGYKENSLTVTHNGAAVAANASGGYTIILAGGENVLVISAEAYAKESVTMSGTIDTATGFNIPSDNLEQLGVYIFKVKCTGANTAATKSLSSWMLDLRVNMAPKAGTNFRAVASIYYTYSEADGAKLGVKFMRGAKDTTECTIGKDIVYFNSANVNAILDKIANGTYTIVLVNSGYSETNNFNVKLYADDGTGNLIYLYSFKWQNFNVLETAFINNTGKGGKITGASYGCTLTHYSETADFAVYPELAGLTYVPATEE